MAERVSVSSSGGRAGLADESARQDQRAERRRRVRAAIGGTLSLAASAIPGVGGAAGALAGRSLSASAGPGGGLGVGGQVEAMELLSVQQQIQQESQQFTLQSNIMRARHDMARAAIQNIRS